MYKLTLSIINLQVRSLKDNGQTKITIQAAILLQTRVIYKNNFLYTSILYQSTISREQYSSHIIYCYDQTLYNQNYIISLKKEI